MLFISVYMMSEWILYIILLEKSGAVLTRGYSPATECRVMWQYQLHINWKYKKWLYYRQLYKQLSWERGDGQSLSFSLSDIECMDESLGPCTNTHMHTQRLAVIDEVRSWIKYNVKYEWFNFCVLICSVQYFIHIFPFCVWCPIKRKIASFGFILAQVLQNYRFNYGNLEC